MTYKDPTRFGENVSFGTGGGIVATFDHNNSPRGGADFKVDGDLKIKKDYYPRMDEEFLGRYKRTIHLLGNGNSIFPVYQALQARQIYFEPILHSDFVLHSIGPKEKKRGNYTSYIYPDGSVVADGRYGPSFGKLEAIRQAAENKR
ncbi:hypothetical protein [Pseudomonas sp. SMN5]|uniref:hypothetical protein n=1 Tax=Pseudomonas sp. SMN5 TaxID=3390198 RepID=UPI003F83CC50